MPSSAFGTFSRPTGEGGQWGGNTLHLHARVVEARSAADLVDMLWTERGRCLSVPRRIPPGALRQAANTIPHAIVDPGTTTHLTEIVELQSQIKLKENFSALGEMYAGIAHEFKNSIATILGYAQMSKLETDVDTLQSYAKEIHKESQALSNMITDFLNFARPVMASIYEVDLVELLKTVIGDVKNLRPGDYDVQFAASGDALVPCDATLIRQSFLNLLINATEALDGKGTVSVLVDAPQDRDHIRVIVEDNGRGIPSHLISKIFFPFFTTKTQGTGLGLALVQKILVAHNGRIELQSTEGKGTRFTVTLTKENARPATN